jgi:hypothetical protein
MTPGLALMRFRRVALSNKSLHAEDECTAISESREMPDQPARQFADASGRALNVEVPGDRARLH